MKRSLDDLRNSLRKLAWPREHRERGKVALRAAGDGRTIEMFIPFESESVDMGFREKIHPSAFTRSIRTGRSSQRNDIFALWSHDSSKPLARQANGTLEFEERDDGLVAVATLNPEVRDHADALELVRSGLVRGTSFGFEAVRDEWEYDEDGEATRSLLEVKLFEVSPVVFPAYQASDIDARSALVAARECGVELGEMLMALREARGGKIPLARREAVLEVVEKVRAMIPEAPPTDDDHWKRKLAARGRLAA